MWTLILSSWGVNRNDLTKSLVKLQESIIDQGSLHKFDHFKLLFTFPPAGSSVAPNMELQQLAQLAEQNKTEAELWSGRTGKLQMNWLGLRSWAKQIQKPTQAHTIHTANKLKSWPIH